MLNYLKNRPANFVQKSNNFQQCEFKSYAIKSYKSNTGNNKDETG